MTEDAPGLAQVNREITLARKCARIERECEKRIQAHYSLQVQLYAFASALAPALGYTPGQNIVGVSSENYIAVRDKRRGAEICRCILEHRAAAEALKVFCARNIQQINSVDVSAARFWPPAPKGPENED